MGGPEGRRAEGLIRWHVEQQGSRRGLATIEQLLGAREGRQESLQPAGGAYVVQGAGSHSTACRVCCPIDCALLCALRGQAAVLAASKYLSRDQIEGLRQLFQSFDTNGECVGWQGYSLRDAAGGK